jgi:hypothetical protein
MRLLALLIFIAFTACAANPHPLAHTSVDDPVWKINPDRWQGENALTTAPTLPAGRIASPQASR